MAGKAESSQLEKIVKGWKDEKESTRASSVRRTMRTGQSKLTAERVCERKVRKRGEFHQAEAADPLRRSPSISANRCRSASSSALDRT